MDPLMKALLHPLAQFACGFFGEPIARRARHIPELGPDR